LFDLSNLRAHDHREIERGHAEALVPMVAALPEKGRADRILVSLGPGSFTGVRIGIATARALGVAWGAQVLGYPTLALVFARSWQPSPRAATVCMNGGHGEWFVQNFETDGTSSALQSLTPEQAAASAVHDVIVGNRANELAAMLGNDRKAIELLPDASKAYLLHETRLTSNLSPIYGRAPDAKPQAAAQTAAPS